MTPIEQSFLRMLARNAEIYSSRASAIDGTAWLDREDPDSLVVAFTVADDPQPQNDIFGDAEKIYLRAHITEITPYPGNPEISFTCEPIVSASGRKYWLGAVVCESPLRIYVDY